MKFTVDFKQQKESNAKAQEFRQELGLNNTGSNNILDTLCKVIKDAEIVAVEIEIETVKNWLTIFNFSNYFSNSIPIEIYASLDYGQLLPWVKKLKKDGKLTATNENLAVNERFATWQKRRNAYFKSHVIGTSDKASMSNKEAIESKRYPYTVTIDKVAKTVTFKDNK